jgi:acyl-CoA synthetase (AMP-forming)/AMP-acid ligase II
MELTAWCEDQLAAFKVPRYVYITRDPLPRSAAKGEIERHAIRTLGGDAVWDREAA